MRWENRPPAKTAQRKQQNLRQQNRPFLAKTKNSAKFYKKRPFSAEKQKTNIASCKKHVFARSTKKSVLNHKKCPFLAKIKKEKNARYKNSIVGTATKKKVLHCPNRAFSAVTKKTKMPDNSCFATRENTKKAKSPSYSSPNKKIKIAKLPSPQIVKSAAAGILCGIAQIFFNAQKLVVFCQSIRTRKRACFDLPSV